MDIKTEELENKFKENILNKVDTLYSYYVERTNASTKEAADNAQRNIIELLQSFGAVKRELDEFDKSLYQKLVSEYNFNFVSANEYFNSNLFRSNTYFLSDGTLNSNINRKNVTIDEIKNLNKKVEEVKVPVEEVKNVETNEEENIAPGISVAPITNVENVSVVSEEPVNTVGVESNANNVQTSNEVVNNSINAPQEELNDVQIAPIKENEDMQKIDLNEKTIDDSFNKDFENKFKFLSPDEQEEIITINVAKDEDNKANFIEQFKKDIASFSTSNLFISLVLIDQEPDEVRNRETNGLTDNERRAILVDELNSRRKIEKNEENDMSLAA